MNNGFEFWLLGKLIWLLSLWRHGNLLNSIICITTIKNFYFEKF